VLDEYNPVSNKEFSSKFFILNLECLKKWATDYQTSSKDLSEDSQFYKKYEKLLSYGVQFPANNTYSGTLEPKAAPPELQKPVRDQPPAQDFFKERPGFAQQQRQSAEEVGKQLAEARQSLVAWILSQTADSLDFEVIAEKLQPLSSVFREHRQELKLLEESDPQQVTKERQFMLDFATALSEAEDGSMSKKALRDSIVKAAAANGWTGQSPGTSNGRPGTHETPSNRMHEKNGQLQPIDELNEGTDKEPDEGPEKSDNHLSSKPDAKSRRSRFGSEHVESSEKSRENLEQNINLEEQQADKNSQKNPSWEFKFSKAAFNGDLKSKEEENQVSWGLQSKDLPKERRFDWNEPDKSDHKEDQPQNFNNFFNDFDEKDSNKEPNHIETGSRKDMRRRSELSKASDRSGRPKESRHAVEQPPEKQRKLSEQKFMTEEKSNSRPNINWDDFAEPSQEDSSRFNDSNKDQSQDQPNDAMKPIVILKPPASGNSKEGSFSKKGSKHDRSAALELKEEKESLKDFFNRSKAEISVSREETGQKRRSQNTSVKIGPPQPKAISSHLLPDTTNRQKPAQLTTDIRQGNSAGVSDKIWDEGELKPFEYHNKSLNRSRDDQKPQSKVEVTAQLEVKKPSKPFSALFDDAENPQPSNLSFRRAQLRSHSRNDSYSKEDRLAMSVPAIVGVGGGFGRQRNKGNSIRINRSSVGDTGLGEGKIIGTASEKTALNTISLKPAVFKHPGSITVEQPKPAESLPLTVDAPPHLQHGEPPAMPPSSSKKEVTTSNFMSQKPVEKSEPDWWDIPEDSAKNTPAKNQNENQISQHKFWENPAQNSNIQIQDQHNPLGVPETVHSDGLLLAISKHDLPPSLGDPGRIMNRQSHLVGEHKKTADLKPEEDQVFNFDDFEAASGEEPDENIEEGFGDESHGDRNKQLIDPLVFTSSQAFSQKLGQGDQFLKQHHESEVDNPDFFNSKEFGLVGGVGVSELPRKQEKLEESLPFTSPVKNFDHNRSEFHPSLTLTGFHAMNIYPRRRLVTRTSVSFHILNKEGMIPAPKNTHITSREFSEQKSDSPAIPILSLKAFTVGYYFPVSKYKELQVEDASTPQIAIRLLTRLSPIEVRPNIDAHRNIATLRAEEYALQDTVDRLEREIRFERGSKNKLAADFESSLTAAISNKEKFADLMVKHTEILKICDDLKLENQLLKRSEDEHRARLMKTAVDDATEKTHPEKSTEQHLLQEFQRRIELLSKENVDLKHRVVEAEVDLQVKESHKKLEESTLMGIEETITRLNSEKRRLQEQTFHLEDAVRDLKEKLVDKEEQALEIDIIKQVLCLEGDDGLEAISVLRGLLMDSQKTCPAETSPWASFMKNQGAQSSRISVNMQALNTLVVIAPSPKESAHQSALGEVKIQESQNGHKQIFESFGGKIKGEAESAERNGSQLDSMVSQATFGGSKAIPSLNVDPKEELFFDSFAPEAHLKRSSEPMEGEREASVGDGRPGINVFSMSHDVGLNPIAEVAQENLENSPIPSPKTEAVRTEVVAPLSFEEAEAKEVVSHEGEEVSAINEAAGTGLAGKDVELADNNRDPKTAQTTKRRLDHYGSWVSDDLFPSIVSPRGLQTTSGLSSFKDYQAMLATSIKPAVYLKFMEDEQQIFLDGSIQLRLLSCQLAEQDSEFSVEILPKQAGLLVKQAGLSNYAGKAISNRLRCSRPVCLKSL
jgi:hypothetical protein